MNSIVIIALLIHWLADFVLQTHEQAVSKSSNNLLLTHHVTIYSLVWFLVIIGGTLGIFGFKLSLLFAAITFVCHWLTDYCTSRIVKRYWLKENYHNAFVVIGFDQILHYVQLLLTYNFIKTMV